jgi:parvulin-like peptidyl-prolyl isomerase
LRRYFAQHRDRYAGSRWEVSQIFVEADTSDAQAVKAAQANLSELADQLRSSGSIAEAFAEAARQHSDSGSAAAGGMIGWVEKDGDLPREVMNAVRNTPVGSISNAVRSALGMHLVYVHRSEPGDLEFDDLTDQAQLRRDAADALFDALLAQQKNAKVVWFVKTLQPPQDVPLVPE